MATCEVCGNDYDKTMEISVAGDSMYCCAHCAAEEGHTELADRS